jgi:hypothetical protein
MHINCQNQHHTNTKDGKENIHHTSWSAGNIRKSRAHASAPDFCFVNSCEWTIESAAVWCDHGPLGIRLNLEEQKTEKQKNNIAKPTFALKLAMNPMGNVLVFLRTYLSHRKKRCWMTIASWRWCCLSNPINPINPCPPLHIF